MQPHQKQKWVCVAVLTFPLKQLFKDAKRYQNKFSTYFRSTGRKNSTHPPELNYEAIKISPKTQGKKMDFKLWKRQLFMFTHKWAKRALWWLIGAKQQLVRRLCVTHPVVVRSPCGSIRSAASSSAWSRGPAAPRSARQRPWARCHRNNTFCQSPKPPDGGQTIS